MSDRFAIAIVGPTCSGKTKISVELAEKIGGEIISVDARQVYKLLDKGTAKPDQNDLQRIPHHLVSTLSLEDEISAGTYSRLAWDIVRDIFSRRRVPILVGGSGLYIRAIVDGLFDAPEISREIRSDLRERLRNEPAENLLEELKRVDPEAAEGLLPQNYKRIVRALEIYYSSGRRISDLRNEFRQKVNFNTIQFGMLIDRKALYQRIEKRVDEMLENGLVEEVRQLLKKGFDPNLNSLQTVGYREPIRYLKGEINYSEMVDQIKMNTRRYAKRQMTWFRKDSRIIWIETTGREASAVAAEIVSRYSG